MQWLYVVAAIAAGFLVSFQPGANRSMGIALAESAGGGLRAGFQASFLSMAGGMLCALLVNLAMQSKFPRIADLQAAPWYAWLGGVIGFILVTASLLLAGKLSAGLLIGSILVGQILGSLVIDWFGLVSFPVSRSNLGLRLFGTLLLVGGLVVIAAAKPPAAKAPLTPQTPDDSAGTDEDPAQIEGEVAAASTRG